MPLSLLTQSFLALSPADQDVVKTGHHAHLRGSELRCILPATFDLRTDYESPKSHRVVVYNPQGQPNYRVARVWIDHEATGTGTTGTGDTTCCRSNPNR